MPEACSSEADAPRADTSGISYSDTIGSIQSEPNTNRGEVSDTGDDVTTDTLSKGRLKHELRLTRTHLATKAMILENNQKLSTARELELQDEIRTLNRRLALANTRCEAAMLVASQAAQVEDQLNHTVQATRHANRELAQLQQELHSVRHYFTQLPLNQLVFTTDGPEKAFKINVSSYSLLTSSEVDQLRTKESKDLCILELVQFSIHCMVSLFSEELIRLRRQLENAAESLLFDSVQGPRVLSPQQGKQSPPGGRRVRFTEADSSEEVVVKSTVQPQQKSMDTFVDLEAANKQIDLLSQDKEYLMKQASSLTERLASTERDLGLAKHRVSALEAELTDLRAQSNQNQTAASQQMEACLRKQLDEFNDLTGQELARIRAFHDELQLKEFNLLREQRDKAVTESESLRLELSTVKNQLNSAKSELNLLRTTCEAHDGITQPWQVEEFPLRKQLAQATIEMEAARVARNDALLQVQKLNAQLDASKQAFYGLRTKSHLDCANLESKLTAAEQKLRAYEEMENGIDEVIELASGNEEPQANIHPVMDQLEHFCVESRRGVSAGSMFLPTLAARRLEHSMKLAKQVTQLKTEHAKLSMERDAAMHEAKLSKAEAERALGMIKLKTQPADCLVISLTQTEKQLRQCQAELDQMRSERDKLKLARDQMQLERDALARDLERVLTRRQNFSMIRQQLNQLTNQRERKRSDKKCTACSATRHRITSQERNRTQSADRRETVHRRHPRSYSSYRTAN